MHNKNFKITPITYKYSVSNKVLSLRKKIDRVDAKIIHLLNKRSTYSLKIGNIKDRECVHIEQPLREREIVTNIINNNCGPMSTKEILEIYVIILDSSKRIQKDPYI
jgi:chorismate mutase